MPAIGPVHSPQDWQASIQSGGHVSGLPPLSRASPLPQVALPSCCCLLEMHTCGSWLASDRACAFAPGLAGQCSICRPCVVFATAIAGKPAHRWRRHRAAACLKCVPVGAGLPAIGPVHSPQGCQASARCVGHVSVLPSLSRASPLPQVTAPSCCCLLVMGICGSWLASDRACAFTPGLAGQCSILSIMCRVCHRYHWQARSHR